MFNKKEIEKEIQFDDVKKVWLIRHGQSTANAGAATENHITIPLSVDGQEQAKQISLSFQETPILIITSPFLRT
ncbi:Histidine phosphatase superfamily (branch 1) [Pelosinus propionicus DSM 13327]|uniref:Histidine phosphatase superfamily (Branch 1) n=1 Tax=Pelosinus propionicus DSM 13327 TaxID=1123291 RepID=A0A1I4NUM8_9FIRM|nr:Histidine phosphatase superfamily (branch 1) [Pelosinus propionicus DSM 13327]